MKTKKEKLEALDGLLLDRMIEIMQDTDDSRVDELSALGVPMNYLKNNQVVADKPKSTVEEDTQRRLKEAEERRKKGQSK